MSAPLRNPAEQARHDQQVAAATADLATWITSTRRSIAANGEDIAEVLLACSIEELDNEAAKALLHIALWRISIGGTP